MTKEDKTTGVSKISYRDLPPLNKEVRQIMKTELGISLKLSTFYFIFVFTVPVLNWTAPALMKTKIIGGMSLTWFLTSIVAMVMAFVIALLHIYAYQKKFGAELVQSGTPNSKGAAR